jgi:SAM-dependent methyltransferase
VADDRWWRGFDAVILDAVAVGSRVLDVGCGDGALVDYLAARGLDAVGVDPRAPTHPRLIRKRVEEVGSIGHFEAVSAVMALHHAQLETMLAAIVRLLQPGGRLFIYEFAWEKYDERAASWLSVHDHSDADNSVASWQLEHGDLHASATIRSALNDTFDLRRETHRPYLARMLGILELEHEEQAMITEGALPALGWWYFADARA